MNLPEPIAAALAPLFERLPLDQAMPELVPKGPKTDLIPLVESIVQNRAIKPAVAAGLWLYIDDLDRSHTLSQGLTDHTGSFWHGIMHRREGDFSNSHYWFHRVGMHPAIAQLPNYNAHKFIDQVEAARCDNPADLVELQRAEWQALFQWCANR
ncbi:MAG: hypothetical protein IT368_15465 [Candidatus Hydrogenedentes bacterium]|nr:hypothetical protein [Candidatus Hydrogenedentota bacterium]